MIIELYRDYGEEVVQVVFCKTKKKASEEIFFAEKNFKRQ